MSRALITAVLLLGALASGCGGDDTGDKGDKGADDPARTSSAPGADDDGNDPGAAGELPRFCELLTADQLTEAVGAPVTLTTGPFDACEFDQEDPRALSGSVGVVEVGADNGGFESYRSGAVAALTDGVDHPVTGLDGEAFVATGTLGGGESIQAGGGVLADGGRVYTVNLVQSEGRTADELVAIGKEVLRLLLEVA